MSEDFIRFENVKKVYHTGEVELTALHDVSFSVARGEICVIVGESGAGKTTLLNILGGMDTLTAGRIVVDGEEVSAFDERRLTAYRRSDVGFVFQFYNLIPNLTALENVELAARLGRESADAADEVGKIVLQGGLAARDADAVENALTLLEIGEDLLLVNALGGVDARHQSRVMAEGATEVAGGGEQRAGDAAGVVEEGHFLESVDDHGGSSFGGIFWGVA